MRRGKTGEKKEIQRKKGSNREETWARENKNRKQAEEK